MMLYPLQNDLLILDQYGAEIKYRTSDFQFVVNEIIIKPKYIEINGAFYSSVSSTIDATIPNLHWYWEEDNDPTLFGEVLAEIQGGVLTDSFLNTLPYTSVWGATLGNFVTFTI